MQKLSIIYGSQKDSKYFPFFQDCLGTLDGTHIPAHVPFINGAAYQNRKGVLSQNVLEVCKMDLQFCYILAGWEGSLHNDEVLEGALFDNDFMIPDKKYYLAEGGRVSQYRIPLMLLSWCQISSQGISHG